MLAVVHEIKQLNLAYRRVNTELLIHQTRKSSKVLTAFSKRNPLLSITRATSAKNAKSGENDDRRGTILHVFFLSNLSSSFNQEPFLFSIHSKRSFVNIYYNYGILFTARVMDQSCLSKRQRRETVV